MHGHAARRTVGAITEQMKEDGAACAFHARVFIVIGWEDDIIGIVGAPHAFADVTERKADLAVILAGGRHFAPAHVGSKRRKLQSACWFWQAVSTEIAGLQSPHTNRRFAIAFPFPEGKARAAQPTGKCACTDRQLGFAR